MRLKKSKRMQKCDAVFDALESLIFEKGIPPTRAEIAARMGWGSATSVAVWLDRLESQGRIKIEPDTPRGISIVSRQTKNCTDKQFIETHAL